MAKRIRRTIAASTASVGVALVLASCDSSHTPPRATGEVPAKVAKADKNGPAEVRVRTIVVEQLGLKSEPKLSDRLVEDLGADSLDIVELVMALEEEFEISIPDEEAVNMKTFGDMVAYVGKAAKR